MPYFEDIARVIADNLEALRATGALAARPGRMLDHDGYPTDVRAIILLTEHGAKLRSVPQQFDGFPLDVREATPAQLLQLTHPVAFAARAAGSRQELIPAQFPGQVALRAPAKEPEAAAAVPALPYTPPAGASYDPLPGPTHVKVICSVSPDNGWSVLSRFLDGTQRSLTTAMYDFTSAHIERTVARALIGKPFELVLDNPAKNPTADQTDQQTVAKLEKALPATFRQQWALTPRDPLHGAHIFPSAYHIKVAVRDAHVTKSAAVWLSSGNWNNSNQPIFDSSHPDVPLAERSDRDWHVVLFSKELAAWFKKFIDHDFAVAKEQNAATVRTELLPAPLPKNDPVIAAGFTSFVPPLTVEDTMTITPLLTPDTGIYVDRITALIASAQTRFDLQLQYIDSFAGANDTAFAALIDALAAAEARGVAIRMIFSEFQQESILELMREAKLAIDHDHVRIQNNVHNKGMLVDGRLTVVSSQNWSGAGVLRNRDAGLIIDNAQVNAYFGARFDYDWKTLATAKPKSKPARERMSTSQ